MKCGGGMKAVEMRTGMHGSPAVVSAKKKSIADSTKGCAVECHVCPECGYIELKASKPGLFQNA